MRTQKQMFEDIINWEMDAGESFLDCFDSSFRDVSFMCWAFGKGYITQEQFNAWENDDSICISPDDILFGQEVYSVVQEPEWNFKEREEYDREYHKSKMILAEFMSSSVAYQERFDKFLEEN